MSKVWRIGTRGSRLALWQAHYIQDELSKNGHESEVVVIKTQGDRVQHLSFDKLEGKGFFTKEIEQHLTNGDVDLAVHSLKDLPTEKHPELKVAALTARADPADVLLIRPELLDQSMAMHLPKGAKVGTSSLRRQALLLDIRPDLQCLQLRGNVPTRVQKLMEGQYDAIMLAKAGLDRLELDLTQLHSWALSPREFVPAAGQGVVAVQIRRDDDAMSDVVRSLHHASVAKCTNVERKVLQLMEGGCHIPLGAYCEMDPLQNFHVWAAWQAHDEEPLRRVKVSLGTTHGLADAVVEALKEIKI